MDEDFIFNKNSYVAFDGKSLRDIIVSRLNRGQVFTDQNYQGSNLSAIIDVIAYSFSNLLFYLNKTSSESLFSESQIYENMNRIVKLLNYKPVGPQAQTVPIRIAGSGLLPKGNYIIPRYSYINVGANIYSFNEDISFSKTTDIYEQISSINDKYSLSQGIYNEYPIYTSGGIDNEKIYLAVDDSLTIDFFNIHAYVKPYNSDTWQKWTKVEELFLQGANDSVYEIRYNENKRYEIIFGDNINGKKLQQGDQVAIYYLSTTPNAESLGINAISRAAMIFFNSLQFNEILNDTGLDVGDYLSISQSQNVIMDNEYPSTEYSSEENVDDIRKNAPKKFRSQYRLVTKSDYETFVQTNYKNLIADVKFLNNEDYLNGHIKYLYNLGLKNPQEDTTILFNQINFSNSCNFNNLYMYLVPKNQDQEILTPAQKEYILETIEESKIITTNVVPIDPVYLYMDFYLKDPSKILSTTDISQTTLRIIKTENTRRASSAIALDIKNIFELNFSRTTSKLGQVIDIYDLANQILNIDGVNNVQTYRKDINLTIEGISLLVWNPIYPDSDVQLYTQNTTVDDFKYPIFNDLNNILNRIEIVEKSGVIKLAEF